MPTFDDVKRSRFKMTLIVTTILSIVLLFPTYIIWIASKQGIFELVAVWASWGLVVSAIPTVAVAYVNKETQRPSSSINIGLGNAGSVGKIGKNIIENYKPMTEVEDYSDPKVMNI